MLLLPKRSKRVHAPNLSAICHPLHHARTLFCALCWLEAGTISAPGNYGAASQNHKVMNAETTASHITAVMKIATTQPGPRRRYVMQMANQKEAKRDSDFAVVNRAT
jgi:hypothetical protein